MNLYEFMEDFDNAELDDYERDEQLRNAVVDYNEEYGTAYKPAKALLNYKSYIRNKQYEQ